LKDGTVGMRCSSCKKLFQTAGQVTAKRTAAEAGKRFHGK